jgi:hypothetical protein
MCARIGPVAVAQSYQQLQEPSGHQFVPVQLHPLHSTCAVRPLLLSTAALCCAGSTAPYSNIHRGQLSTALLPMPQSQHNINERNNSNMRHLPVVQHCCGGTHSVVAADSKHCGHWGCVTLVQAPSLLLYCMQLAG